MDPNPGPRLLQGLLEGQGLRRQLHFAQQDLPQGPGLRLRWLTKTAQSFRYALLTGRGPLLSKRRSGIGIAAPDKFNVGCFGETTAEGRFTVKFIILAATLLLAGCASGPTFRGAPPAGMSDAEYKCKLTGVCPLPKSAPQAGVTGPYGF
jgi:hypothetical protein